MNNHPRHPFRLRPGALIALCLASLTTFAGPLEEAARTYDLPTAKAIAAALPGDDNAEQRARAHLLVAELLRIDFEFLPESATKERRALGKEIDEAADTGLLAAASMTESSEKYRLTADLLGTKIRSTYRAGKFKDEMNRAIDKALDLDPNNAYAIIARAKTFIFRPDPSGEELQQAFALLENALMLNAALERAKLLQAHAHDLLGEHEKAIALWEALLAGNSDCKPARRALENANG